MARWASTPSGSGTSESITGSSSRVCTMRSSSSRSLRFQPLEPRMSISAVQMKRRSVGGSYPAVAPQVSTRPRWRTQRSERAQVSPPVKLTTTS